MPWPGTRPGSGGFDETLGIGHVRLVGILPSLASGIARFGPGRLRGRCRRWYPRGAWCASEYYDDRQPSLNLHRGTGGRLPAWARPGDWAGFSVPRNQDGKEFPSSTPAPSRPATPTPTSAPSSGKCKTPSRSSERWEQRRSMASSKKATRPDGPRNWSLKPHQVRISYWTAGTTLSPCGQRPAPGFQAPPLPGVEARLDWPTIGNVSRMCRVTVGPTSGSKRHDCLPDMRRR